jgi:hypothetical protein
MSRDSQAGFFTLGIPADRYRLPHPPLGLPVILLIRRVLLRAFELLRENSFNLSEATEDQITAAVRSTIENRLRQTGEVKGFHKRSYDTVIRQGQWANYDNSRLSKAPDLFFKLRDDECHRHSVLSEFDGLFVEAKPVDSNHAAGSKYCDDGLIRFVSGDYARAMHEGLMLADARHGRTISEHLAPAMEESNRMRTLGTSKLPQSFSHPAAKELPKAEKIHVSTHRRAFSWPDGKGLACHITIYHFWHDCG